LWPESGREQNEGVTGVEFAVVLQLNFEASVNIISENDQEWLIKRLLLGFFADLGQQTALSLPLPTRQCPA